MKHEHFADRRSFLKTGGIAGAALVAGATFAEEAFAWGSIPQGDIDILRFLAAAEILETDLWEQYNELAGIQDKEEPSGSGNGAFTAKLKVLDGDMDQYVHDNTEDERSHQPSSTLSWFQSARSRLISNHFALYLAVRLREPIRQANGSPISFSLRSTPAIGQGIAAAPTIRILTLTSIFRRRSQA